MSNEHLPSWIQHSAPNAKTAVAYYRHSAQDRQENSVEIQKDQVSKFAEEHDIEIIREFIDKGVSGLSTEGRDGFNELMDDYVVGGKDDFDYVLVLDVSRFGRFQDTDLSAYYQGLCAKNGKNVIYTSIGLPKDDGLMHGLHLSIERYRASYYSKELSGKVWKGQEKIVSQGFWGGGMAPYGMNRLLLDEQRKPVRILKRGEHKAIHNQRVTLTPGDEKVIAVINEIFDLFVNHGKTPELIVEYLNECNISSPGNSKWCRSAVLSILKNEIYAGTMLWNKTSSKLKTPSHANPKDDWVSIPKAFDAIVPPEMFQEAQRIMHAIEMDRLKRYAPDEMLTKLKRLYDKYGFISGRLISANKEMVSSSTYAHHFHSIDEAFQAIHQNILDEKKIEVMDTLASNNIGIQEYDDLIVVDNSFCVHIQPFVPMPAGYEVYWAFHPHRRREVDLTIGIPLSCPDDYTTLGYLCLPRMLFDRKVRIHSSAIESLDLYGYRLLEIMNELRR